MTSRRHALYAVLGFGTALSGCSVLNAEPGVRSDLIDINHAAAEALVKRRPVQRHHPLLVATFVNLDDLQRSSRFGRLASEMVAGKLASMGYPVKELKLREQLYMQPAAGALLLSREVREISQSHQAEAVVVGTYSTSGRMVYVNLKLVHPEGNRILAAHDYALPLDANLAGLLY
jgi:TolB-like protein